MPKIIIRPQPGPQTQFLSSRADITFYGGAAFGGKTFGLLMDPLRHLSNGRFKGTAFRRHTTELIMPGGLLHKAKEMYMPIGGKPRSSSGDLGVKFSNGWWLAFKHLQLLDTIYQYQGLETDWLGFDELTHFYKMQFTYLITRARSTNGITPRIVGTLNPDPDSWVKEDYIKWWLDEEGRYADPAKSGVIRWFIMDQETDELIWRDTQAEIEEDYGPELAETAMSFTFIASKLTDNKIGLAADPRYAARLAMQDKVTRARLRDGDWLIKAIAGTYFQRGFFEEVDMYPELIKKVRCWDRAATTKTPQNDPDYTCSVRMGKTAEGKFIIEGLSSMRASAGKVSRIIENTAEQDGRGVEIVIFKDPGAAGKGEAERESASLGSKGFQVTIVPATTGKETNAKSFSKHADNGHVQIWRGIPQRERNLFYSQLEQFPEFGHDDYVDAGSGAFNELANAVQLGIF